MLMVVNILYKSSLKILKKNICIVYKEVVYLTPAKHHYKIFEHKIRYCSFHKKIQKQYKYLYTFAIHVYCALNSIYTSSYVILFRIIEHFLK